MQNVAIFRRAGVVSFNRKSFKDACAKLMRMVEKDGHPDVMIGIPTGGMYVAEAMSAAGGGVPLLPLTFRRPSTRHKRSPGLRKLIALLPRPVLDQMRVVEHSILTDKSASPPSADSVHLDSGELDVIGAAIGAAGAAPSILVVDDAVDTGTTLSVVLDAVHKHAPRTATVRSAVITVTTAQPLVAADYMLYRQLCRFPWSLDAMAVSQS